MKATPAEIERVLALLEETPRCIAATAASLDDPRLHAAPDQKTWSAAGILEQARGHLWTQSHRLQPGAAHGTA